jgi:hypothetical protein
VVSILQNGLSVFHSVNKSVDTEFFQCYSIDTATKEQQMDIVTITPGSVLSNIVKLTGSKKRKAILARPTTEVRLSGTYWDGGSRSNYFLVDLNTMQAKALASYAPPQFGGPKEDPVVKIEPHQAVVEAGVFCGKASTPTVYFHPEWGQAALQQG